MQDNRTTLINAIVKNASYLYEKQSVDVTNNEIKAAVEHVIGSKKIHDNEFLLPESVEVSVTVSVQGKSDLCRNLIIKFKTHEYLIANSNWFLVPHDMIRSPDSDNGRYFKYGSVMEYNGPLEDQRGKRNVIGRVSDSNERDTLVEESCYGNHIISFETQDVFVVQTSYTPTLIEPLLISVPSRKKDKIYDVPTRNMPCAINVWKEIHYPAKPVRTWYGRVKYMEATDNHPNAYIFTPSKNNRGDYRYDMTVGMTEGVEKVIRNKSASFDPHSINNITTCQL